LMVRTMIIGDVKTSTNSLALFFHVTRCCFNC
jgi:hypothetical protein